MHASGLQPHEALPEAIRPAQLDVDLKGNSELPSELCLELGIIDLSTSREVGQPWNPLA